MKKNFQIKKWKKIKRPSSTRRFGRSTMKKEAKGLKKNIYIYFFSSCSDLYSESSLKKNEKK